MSSRKRNAKPGISKAVAYSVGVFTVSTDLRAIVELLGLERMIQLATALHHELTKEQRAKHKNKGRRVKSVHSVTDSTLAKQLSETVQRSLAHYKLNNVKPLKKRAA